MLTNDQPDFFPCCFLCKAVFLAIGLGCLPLSGSLGFERPGIEFDPGRYTCQRINEPLTIDGSLDEPAWQAAAVTADFVDIEGPQQPAPFFPTLVRMLYDDEFFYVAAELIEPHVWGTLTERDAVIYHDNDFEVFIDPDGDNHLYYELEINALGTEWDLMLVKPYRDGGPAINAWDIQGLRTAVQVNGTLNDPRDTDEGWVVEIAFPWAVLAQASRRPAPPEPGDIWRVNFSRVQWDTEPRDGRYVKVTDPGTGEPVPEYNWVWSPQGLVAMHYPEMWGEVMFSDQGEGDFANSAEHQAILAAASLMPLYYLQKQWREVHGKYATSLWELGLLDTELPSWDPTGTEAVVVLPAGWFVSLEACANTYQATLKSPHGIATVDQDGRLERKP
jgi:hypothetical protein